MTATADSDLLSEFAAHRNEAAFAGLVRRHLDFVYATALRRVNGDSALAQDVAQAVFTDLARKAAQLTGHRTLAGWLHTSTRYAAAKAVRGEQRRRVREQAAGLMDSPNDPARPLEWERIRPMLDAALDELNERDRTAILLRHFHGLDFATVGERLAVSDNTARMRVERALEKLRHVLGRRGVTSTSAALALVLTAHGSVAAPVGLAASVTAQAVAAGAAATGGILAWLGLTKWQVGMLGALAVAGSSVCVVQEVEQRRLRAELVALAGAPTAAELSARRAENASLGAQASAAASLPVSDREWEELRTQVLAAQERVERAASQSRRLAAESRLRAREAALPLQQLDSLPRATTRSAPQYPPAMRESRTNGDVLVEFVIDESGRVADAKVLRSSAAAFEAPTLEAVRTWQFAPGLKDGRPVAARATQQFQYSIASDAPLPALPDWF